MSQSRPVADRDYTETVKSNGDGTSTRVTSGSGLVIKQTIDKDGNPV